MELVEKYARSWPRAVFDYVISDPGKRVRFLAKELPILRQPGVYVLYRDDIPYYIGKAGNWLWHRLETHARKPDDAYINYWNYFSVFVIHDAAQRDAVEAILIAAFPTANNAKPKLNTEKLPAEVVQLWRQQRNVRRSTEDLKRSAAEAEVEDAKE